MAEIKAEVLARRFALGAHPENGMFVERHYAHEGPSRAASGSIYYYVAPGERTCFHRIDCDEYWVINCGAALELWVVTTDGRVDLRRLGTEPGTEPLVYLRRGEVFAARHRGKVEDGSFVSCVTVPRFTYDGFEMFEDAEARKRWPDLGAFFED